MRPGERSSGLHEGKSRGGGKSRWMPYFGDKVRDSLVICEEEEELKIVKIFSLTSKRQHRALAQGSRTDLESYKVRYNAFDVSGIITQ